MFAYSIYDSASAAYMRPFFLGADQQALRAFSDLALDAEHDIGRHPEDYSLYLVGEFDDNKGELKGIDRTCLATAQECIAAARKIEPGSLKEVKAQ